MEKAYKTSIAEPELPYLETIALKSTRPQEAATSHKSK
jgi:hypothetical protein